MAHGSPPKLNNFCRNVSLSAHCDKRKEKDRLFVCVDRCYPASTAREMHRDEDVTHGIGALRWWHHTGANLQVLGINTWARDISRMDKTQVAGQEISYA